MQLSIDRIAERIDEGVFALIKRTPLQAAAIATLWLSLVIVVEGLNWKARR